MKKHFLHRSLAARILGVILALWPVSASVTGAVAAEERVGYSNVRIQLMPLMAPYRTSRGIQYEVVTLRVVLAPGETERAACFMIPMIHEKFLYHLYNAKLSEADFVGQRREVMEKNLLNVAVAATDKSFYTAVEMLDDSRLLPTDGKTNSSMDTRSTTLSAQCR